MFGICIINIIIIIIIISSVCWSLQSAETNGQYLSGETWAAPGSRCGHLPAAFLAPRPRVVALLLYLDKPFFRDCRVQRGPGAVLPHGPAGEQLREGRARGHVPGASKEARQQGDPSLPGLPAKLGRSLTRLCYCRLQSEEVLLLLLVIKLHVQDWKMKNRFVFTFL